MANYITDSGYPSILLLKIQCYNMILLLKIQGCKLIVELKIHGYLISRDVCHIRGGNVSIMSVNAQKTSGGKVP